MDSIKSKTMKSKTLLGSDCLKTFSLRTVGVLTLFLGSPSLLSAGENDRGFYVGAGMIESKVGADGFAQSFRMRTSYSGSFPEEFADQSTTGWSVVAGYRVVPYFAVEGGYVNVGDVTFSPAHPLVIFYSNTSSASLRDTHLEIEAWTFTLIGSYPVGNWEPYAKVGALFSDVSATTERFSCTCGPGIANPSSSSSLINSSQSFKDGMVAAGLGYNFANHYFFALEAALVGEDELKSLSAVFRYRF